jgi:hypothetical protein
MSTSEPLSIIGIVRNGIELGIRNFFPLLGAVFLWAITFWIPYINVGTTIGIKLITAKAARGEEFSAFDIFEASNRKPMPEFFLTWGLELLVVFPAYFMLLIPAIVLSVAFSQATFLTLDKGYDPIQSLTKSNEITYGKKWTIFLGEFLLLLAIIIVIAVVGSIAGLIHMYLQYFLVFILLLLTVPAFLSARGYIYDTLTKEAGI